MAESGIVQKPGSDRNLDWTEDSGPILDLQKYTILGFRSGPVQTREIPVRTGGPEFFFK